MRVVGIKVTFGGTGYKEPPNVTIVGDGKGAQAGCAISNGSIVGTTVHATGSGYSKDKTKVFFMNGGGVGAAGEVVLDDEPPTPEELAAMAAPPEEQHHKKSKSHH